MKPTLYSVLGMPPGATLGALHAAYIQLAVLYHPDKHGDEEKFRELTLAWATLKDSRQRAAYDAKLKLAGGQCRACRGSGYMWGRRLCAKCGATGQEEKP
jgi:curved DNA-binding protein CbpA